MQNAFQSRQELPRYQIAYENNPTLSAIFDAYMAEKNNALSYRPCKHPGSIASHIKVLRALWGDLEIEAFRKGSPSRVQDQVTEWRGAGLAFATCRKRCTIMRAAFRLAIRKEIIERGQEPVFELPPNSPPRERFVDPVKELPRLLKACEELRTPDHTRLFVIIALITGQRSGAIEALRWSHVDFEKRVIMFRETERADERSKKRRVNQPMSDLLYKYMVEAYERRECEAVLAWRGKPIKKCYYSVKQVFKRAGLGDVRRHDLRRSSATYVFDGLKGDLSKAANHIGDTEQMARKVYVQPGTAANLPGIEAATSVIEAAKKAG